MIWSVLLFDLVPLIAFAVLDALGNVRYALIGAIIAALLNLLYSQFFLGGIDAISLIFVGLIVLFAGLSYYAQNPLFFKLKPTAIACVTASIMFATSAIGTPVMVEMADHYAPMMPEMVQTPLAQERLRAALARTNLHGIWLYSLCYRLRLGRPSHESVVVVGHKRTGALPNHCDLRRTRHVIFPPLHAHRQRPLTERCR